MDLWGALLVFLLAFLIMSCCGYCCSTKRRGAILSTPVVVTSTTHTAPGGYPVTQIPTSGGYQTSVYATNYPAQTVVTTQMPMPMPMPVAQPPPTGIDTYSPIIPVRIDFNPPSYDMAVGGVPTYQPNNTSYGKQAPYNPSYPAQ